MIESASRVISNKPLGWAIVTFWIVATTAAAHVSYNVASVWIFSGVVVGIAQGASLLFWHKGVIPFLWLIATAAGWALGFMVTLAIGEVLSSTGIGGGS